MFNKSIISVFVFSIFIFAFLTTCATLANAVSGKTKNVVTAQTPIPSPSPTPEPIEVKSDSFTLFWPLSAGKVQGESFYFLKTLKENIREFFYFSEYKKANYKITLSEKRVVESEKLFLDKKDYLNGEKTLLEANNQREIFLSLTKKSKESGRNVADLLNRFADSLKRQKSFLNYLETQVSEDQNKSIKQDILSIETLLQEVEKK